MNTKVVKIVARSSWILAWINAAESGRRSFAEKNQQLSQARSEAVRNYLIEVAPDLSSRLSAMGYGQSVPKADNRTAEGRKVNRRVEIKVLNPEVLKGYN